MHSRRSRHFLASLCLTVITLVASSEGIFATETPGAKDLSPETAEQKTIAEIHSALAADLQRLNTALQSAPDSISLLSRRGDTYLFLGRFNEAVADFERTIAIDSAQDAPHWRLGIAYYFAGQWEKSSLQFAKYHAYDGHDRENGVWKFLADAAARGLEPARKEMLTYTEFDREPFPELYDLLAGKLTPEAFAKNLADRGLSKRSEVKFFADYYSGLNEELLGHHEAALAKVHAAVFENPMARGEERPSYMWQVSRVHYAWLVKGEHKTVK